MSKVGGGDNLRKHCTFSGCKKPDGSLNYYQIGADKSTGGKDWSALAGSVLCAACYMRFKDRGTLERSDKDKKPMPTGVKKCAFSGCEASGENIRFVQIEANSTAGGRDWSALADSLLCQQCYDRYRKHGSLERADGKPLDGSSRRCMFAKCEKPEDSRRFVQIDGESAAGGQDWSGLAGSVLCMACYDRFRKHGTLEKTARKKAPAGPPKKCGYDKCPKPDESPKFIKIYGDSTAGGQDWGKLSGQTLCLTCYMRYKDRGTLERHKALTDAEKKCSYAGCEKPEESRKFIKIDPESKAGGHDWAPIGGKVLCQICYNRFIKRGTLERVHQAALKPPPKSFGGVAKPPSAPP
eukprot:CAMPEP_0173428086 /NCGR_PEP_ID=MMETSP1357-20121228/7122_1 /TAXON_ID=77926 /ORGANISM="Hemiselmis rufescens, Strain PCC563" /LENGTH=351 /DNA_ID=CAMNT_0014392041 /DNA_START=114 /DNA_END=1166 /DNA_ORIENTATION=-